MDLLAVTSGFGARGRPPGRRREGGEALFQINLFQVDHRRDQLPRVPRDHLDVRVQAGVGGCWPTARTASSRASRTRSGPERPRERRSGARRHPDRGSTRGERHPGAAQKVAQETRDADIAATKEELERLRQRTAAEIEAEKARAISDVRAEVADLALRRRPRRRRDHDQRPRAAPGRRVPQGSAVRGSSD